MSDLTITVVSEDPLKVRVEGADLELMAHGVAQVTGAAFDGTLVLPGMYSVQAEDATVVQDPDDPHLFTVTG